MTDIERRLKALEAENANLRSRLDALQPSKVQPLPPSPVRVSHPMAKIELPTENEYSRLLAIVLDRYPILNPRADSPDHAAQFRAAFIRLSHCGRRDRVDNQRGLGFWLDDCREFCDRHQIHPSWINGAPFTAAVIAHADIQYTIEDWPHAFVCSLQWGGGGIECRNWWRRALSGTLLSPEPPLHSTARPAPARIVRG